MSKSYEANLKKAALSSNKLYKWEYYIYIFYIFVLYQSIYNICSLLNLNGYQHNFIRRYFSDIKYLSV